MTELHSDNSGNEEILGVLISNLGTPDSCQVHDVRKFLKEFLWDARVVKMSRPLWWLILNVLVLNIRPRKSAAAYKKIWSDQGSPLLCISRKQTDLIRQALYQSAINTLPKRGLTMRVELGMRYGNPAIADGLARLRDAGATRFLIVPLYPQFSYTTTASVADEVARTLKKWHGQQWGGGQQQPLQMIRHYFDNPDYIAALAESVTAYWDKNGRAEQLLMSFHGIPQQYADDGDPYAEECQQTAALLAQALNLQPEQWQLCFQSRPRAQKWLTPYVDTILPDLAKQGKSVQVICPGFSADCLETLEEIAIRDKALFIQAGGSKYAYIPCLNDSETHIKMLTKQIIAHRP